MEKLLKLIFHHIPKTGGTFVMNVLKEKFSHCRINFDHLRAGDGRSWVDSGSDEFYSSHWAFDKFNKSEDEFYFTWLRNPIDMFYSGWYYYRMANLPMLPINLISPISLIKSFSSFDAYLDCVIKNKVRFFPRCVWPDNFDSFDFCGFAEEMDVSFKKLSNILGLDFDLNKDKNKTPHNNLYDHRRNEVNDILKKEVDEYLSHKNMLCQSMS